MKKALMIIGKFTTGLLIVLVFSFLNHKTKNVNLGFWFGYVCGTIVTLLFNFLDKKIEEE